MTTTSNKDILIARIIATALWLTDISDKLQKTLIAFDAHFDKRVYDDKYEDVFALDDQIQQLRRVAQYVDQRFQSAMQNYCERFNGGVANGTMQYQGQVFRFWIEDGKWNMMQTRGERHVKIVELEAARNP